MVGSGSNFLSAYNLCVAQRRTSSAMEGSLMVVDTRTLKWS